MKKHSWLLPLLSFSIVLILFRIVYTSTFTFVFLIWNLFLAIVPLYFSEKALVSNKRSYRLGYSLLWLLFFPNSMYIITDLFHLAHRPYIPIWYDLILLFSCAMSGIVLGFLSLSNIEKTFSGSMSKAANSAVIFCIMCLCGYGIYLGRYDRWNSWDIVSRPYYLLRDIAVDIANPIANKEVWALTVCFGIWMYMLYRYTKKIKLG